MRTLSKITAICAALGTSVAIPAPAQAGVDPFIGQMMTVGFNFCPRGWAKAEGQLLPIAQNTALFSLLGTTYGGNGRTTFALPDLRGRAVIGTGTGPGLSTVREGQKGGAEQTTPMGQSAASGSGTRVASAQPTNNRDPYLGMTVCIALTGIYPSRN